MSDEPVAMRALHWNVAAVALGFGLLIGAVVIGAAAIGGMPAAIRWALPTGIVVGIEFWVLHRHLEHNHPAEATEQRFDTLGAANLVTLGRGGLFAAVAGFALLDPVGWIAWVPALLYGLGCALDSVDGFLARASERTTVLGERLDMAIDSLGFVVAPVVAVVWGRLPIWYLSLSAARYLYKAGKTRRERRGLPVFELPESLVRRPLAGLQMTFLTVALAPVLDAGYLFAVAPFVLLPTLLVFLRDYLVVAGHVGGQNNND